MHHLSFDQMQKLKQDLNEQKTGLNKQLEHNDHGDLQTPIRESLTLSSNDNHPADLGTEMFERAKDIALIERMERQLTLIDQSFERMKDQSYGLCQTCGEPIPFERLEAIPYTQYCVHHSPEQSVSSHRPIEERLITHPFGRTSLDEHDTTLFDGEDAWQAVAQMGTSSSPAYAEAPYVDDYGEMYIEEEEPDSYVEPIESFLVTDIHGKKAHVMRNAEYHRYMDGNEGMNLLS